MDFSLKNSLWRAQNLPEGFSLKNGVLSGSHNIKGSYSVPVTVTTPFGSDTKNITIVVKNKPGTEKFSILQNGVEIEKVSIPQLVASIQDGTAQDKYNCTDTQIVIPVTTPRLLSFDENGRNIIIPPHSQNVILNFCNFQNVTLQDGSTRQALVLQFDSALWPYYALFDSNGINRWKFSNLRQWLNSSGLNWFVPAYEGDALTPVKQYYGEFASYVDDDARGFLDLLPDDIVNALLPIRVVTQCYWDDDMPEPELINNVDCDVTFDKVFLPSLQELNFGAEDVTDYHTGEPSYDNYIPEAGIEGQAWAYYLNEDNCVKAHKALDADNLDQFNSDYLYLTRSPHTSNKVKLWYVYRSSSASKKRDIEPCSVDSPIDQPHPIPAFILG